MLITLLHCAGGQDDDYCLHDCQKYIQYKQSKNDTDESDTGATLRSFTTLDIDLVGWGDPSNL